MVFRSRVVCLIGHHFQAIFPSFLELLVKFHYLCILAFTLAVLNGFSDVLAPHEFGWFAMNPSLNKVTIVIVRMFLKDAVSLLLASD